MSLFYRNRNSLVGKKVKNTVLTKVERNLVSKMSDDTKKKKKRQQQLFLSNGLVIANTILALKKDYCIMSVYLFFWSFLSQTVYWLNCFNSLCNITEEPKRNLWLDLFCVTSFFDSIALNAVTFLELKRTMSVAWVSSPKNRELSFEVVQFFAHD